MDKKEPIKISLKMVIIVIVLILAIMGGVIYFVYFNPVKKEDTLIEQTEQIITEQGINCKTNIYITPKEVPIGNEIEYEVIRIIKNPDVGYLGNMLITSKEEFNTYFKRFFEANKEKFEGYYTQLTNNEYKPIKVVIEEFDDEYFEKHNLAINMGTYRVFSVNIQNGIETINFREEYDGMTALGEYVNFITLDKDVDRVNFNIYTKGTSSQKESIIDIWDIWEDYNIVIGILLIIIVSVIIHKSKNKTIKISLKLLLFVLILLNIVYCINIIFGNTADKPIIYLYPTQETEVNVKLEKSESITSSYPKYINGWNVKADVDGNLVDLDTGKNLYALYYENKSNIDFQITYEGFCVKGEDVTEFLEEKLKILGLNDKETEEFIIYWLPKLEKNKYNYIRFATEEEIEKNMPIEITPNPDTFIRVLMVYKPLNKKINVKEQSLNSVERKGFTAVEWGGTEIN